MPYTLSGVTGVKTGRIGKTSLVFGIRKLSKRERPAIDRMGGHLEGVTTVGSTRKTVTQMQLPPLFCTRWQPAILVIVVKVSLLFSSFWSVALHPTHSTWVSSK